MQALRTETINSHTISYTTYLKSEFGTMVTLIPKEKLAEFLNSKTVSGSENFFHIESTRVARWFLPPPMLAIKSWNQHKRTDWYAYCGVL